MRLNSIRPNQLVERDTDGLRARENVHLTAGNTQTDTRQTDYCPVTSSPPTMMQTKGFIHFISPYVINGIGRGDDCKAIARRD